MVKASDMSKGGNGGGGYRGEVATAAGGNGGPMRPAEMPSFIARKGEELHVAWPPVLSEPTAFSRLIYDAKVARGLPYVVSDSHGVQPGGQVPILAAFSTEDLAARFIELLPDYETGRYNLDGPGE